MAMQVAGKVFVVTGAGNGIGRQVAGQLLARGGRVAAADVDELALARFAEEANAGERLSTHQLDVTDAQQVQALPETVIAAHGQVDGLFNIAGIAQNFEPAAGIDEDRMRLIMEVNFYGTTAMVRSFLPHLEQRTEGAVIMNTASLAAIVPVPGAAIYGASKAAVAQFGYGLAQDLRNAKSPVTVTTVIPGTIWTDLVRQSSQTLGTPEAVAKGFAMSADKAAHRMIEATMKGKVRAVVGKDAHVYDGLGRVGKRLAERVSYLQVSHFVYKSQRRGPE